MTDQSHTTNPTGEDNTPEPTIQDLCRRWRYMEAKLKADSIILEEKEFNRLIEEAEEEFLAIEAQIADADPTDAGVNAAVEILEVVKELVHDSGAHDGRDIALIRQAIKVLAFVEPERKRPAA